MVTVVMQKARDVEEDAPALSLTRCCELAREPLEVRQLAEAFGFPQGLPLLAYRSARSGTDWRSSPVRHVLPLGS